MQARLKEEFDADKVEEPFAVSDHRSDELAFEINCEMCNKAFYTTEENRDRIERMLEHGLENNFLCEECQLEFDSLAYNER